MIKVKFDNLVKGQAYTIFTVDGRMYVGILKEEKPANYFDPQLHGRSRRADWDGHTFDAISKELGWFIIHRHRFDYAVPVDEHRSSRISPPSKTKK